MKKLLSKRIGWNLAILGGILLVICALPPLKELFFREQSTVSGRLPGPVIILDAGHGGEDGGAVGQNAVVESHINLAIVLTLEPLLSFYGKEVLLLRDEDISLHQEGLDSVKERKTSDLKNRVALVNEVEDGLLLSIHQNFYSQEKYFGAQVFYREGSEDFADLMQDLLIEHLNPDNHRVAKAVDPSLYLMNQVTVPSVLVECGFLSNLEEEALLATKEYQVKIACVLATAVFRRETEFV